MSQVCRHEHLAVTVMNVLRVFLWTSTVSSKMNLNYKQESGDAHNVPSTRVNVHVLIYQKLSHGLQKCLNRFLRHHIDFMHDVIFTKRLHVCYNFGASHACIYVHLKLWHCGKVTPTYPPCVKRQQIKSTKCVKLYS